MQIRKCVLAFATVCVGLFGCNNNENNIDSGAVTDTGVSDTGRRDVSVTDVATDARAGGDAGLDVIDASRGDSTTDASTGDGATDASTGDGATDASTGDGATDASTGDGATDASTGDGASSPTWTQVYTTIISGRCNPCHTSGGGFTNGNLDLSSRNAAYMNLVNVATAGNACSGQNRTRVVPNSPNTSILYLKVSPDHPSPCGNKMPPGAGSLPAADANLIEAWIAAGALNN